MNNTPHFSQKILMDICRIGLALSGVAMIAMALCVPVQADAAEPAQPLEPRPRLYLTPADVARFREQANRPELAATYARLETDAQKSVAGWLKKYPAAATPRTTGELLEIGKRDNPGSDFKTVATAFALHPTPELGQVLREKLLTRIGARQIKNHWRPSGIHEGEAAMQFLEAYDLAAASGIFSSEDQGAIKEELRNCAHFLEGWMLDNQFSQGYTEYYRKVYCLNFHVFAAAVVGNIAMYYPDFPESAEWLRLSQTELIRSLFTEFAIDGGYGEGSLHYWHPTYRALLQFMVASRNLGVRDYFADPAVADTMRRTLAWRMDQMEPDGRSFAVGDSDRDAIGADYLEQGGGILREPVFVWAGRTALERTAGGLFPADPYELFHVDLSAKPQAPANLFANYPYSGLGIFRSGWGARDNYFLLKYGTTFVGRRENENGLVISGHAHADALEIELHHQGIPITVDPGRVGRYQDWDTYGGYCKATVAHNTVGLGNPWGYDRLDGQYARHVQKHGAEFLYETSQKNIGRADMELRAFGDTGQAGIISARLQTYAEVSHQRTVVWFRDSGVAVVHDRLESDKEQPYEWYLNPVGKLLKQDKTLTFGDDVARLDVVPILPRKAHLQIIGKGDPNVPPYYVALRPDDERRGARPGKPYEVKDRWGQFTLLTLQAKARKTEFLNVLVSYEKVPPLASAPLGGKGARLTGAAATLLVAGGGNDDSALAVDGEFGVVRLEKGQPVSYALHHGHGLKLGRQDLVKVELLSQPWAPLFDSAVTALVSLADRRASFSFPLSPVDRGLVRFPPRLVAGEEPVLPMRIAVSFRVNEKPRRVVALRSDVEMPVLDDSALNRKTIAWKADPHQGHYLRETVDFTYDETRQAVTVILDFGIRQLVWE